MCPASGATGGRAARFDRGVITWCAFSGRGASSPVAKRDDHPLAPVVHMARSCGVARPRRGALQGRPRGATRRRGRSTPPNAHQNSTATGRPARAAPGRLTHPLRSRRDHLVCIFRPGVGLAPRQASRGGLFGGLMHTTRSHGVARAPAYGVRSQQRPIHPCGCTPDEHEAARPPARRCQSAAATPSGSASGSRIAKDEPPPSRDDAMRSPPMARTSRRAAASPSPAPVTPRARSDR